MVVNTRRRGELGEAVAAAFLTLKGYEIVERNVRFARREVDLVARDGGALVVVEVKLRWGGRYGTAAEAIDERKLGRLRTALAGIMRDAPRGLTPRIDVVAVDVDESADRMVVEHFVGVG